MWVHQFRAVWFFGLVFPAYALLTVENQTNPGPGPWKVGETVMPHYAGTQVCVSVCMLMTEHPMFDDVDEDDQSV